MRRKRKKKHVPERVSSLLAAAYPSREPEELKAVRAFYWWEKAVPERVVENVRPVKLSHGVLTVHAKNSVWTQEMTYLKGQILEALNRKVPDARIKRIHVKQGPLPPKPEKRERPVHIRPRVHVSQLPPELAKELAAVSDDRVRDAIQTAATVVPVPKPAKPKKS